ncbi:hypothetical protein DFH06DRAFT_1386523 [Mycena polygramma]|nr:hypothetical protein DFH06DRAFT_1386523 [Mycena polygramma]
MLPWIINLLCPLIQVAIEAHEALNNKRVRVANGAARPTELRVLHRIFKLQSLKKPQKVSRARERQYRELLETLPPTPTPPSPDTDEDAGQSSPVAAQPHLRTAYRISSFQIETGRTFPEAASSQTTGLSEAFTLKRKNHPADPERSHKSCLSKPPSTGVPLTPRKAQDNAQPAAYLKPPPAPVFSGYLPAPRTPLLSSRFTTSFSRLPS